MALDPAVIVSKPLSSPLRDAYASPEFKLAWDNEVHLHVAENLLNLRRYRELSQAKVADDVKTSQSAIARIESAQENITLGTLQRLIVALKGRFRVSIAPAELQLPEWPFQWWNVVGTGICSVHHWTFKAAQSTGVGTTQHVIAAWSTHHTMPSTNPKALPVATGYVTQVSDAHV